MYGLLNLLQLASTFKILQAVNRRQCVSLGITYIVHSCVLPAYVKIFKGLSLNSTEFLYLSKHPPWEYDFSLLDKWCWSLKAILFACKRSPTKNFLSRLLSHSSRTAIFVISPHRLKEHLLVTNLKRTALSSPFEGSSSSFVQKVSVLTTFCFVVWEIAIKKLLCNIV